MSAAEDLLALMEDLSEEHWCAGWMDGLERALYERAFLGADPSYGLGPIDPESLAALRTLATESGAWWRLRDEAQDLTMPWVTVEQISLEEAHRLWGKP